MRDTSIGCLLHTPSWEPGPQSSICPDWESNQRPSGSQAGAQSTEPHQSELYAILNTFFFRRESLVSSPFKMLLPVSYKNQEQVVLKEKLTSKIYTLWLEFNDLPTASGLTGQSEKASGKGRWHPCPLSPLSSPQWCTLHLRSW